MCVCGRDHVCIPDWLGVCDSPAYTSLVIGCIVIHTEDCFVKKKTCKISTIWLIIFYFNDAG